MFSEFITTAIITFILLIPSDHIDSVRSNSVLSRLPIQINDLLDLGSTDSVGIRFVWAQILEALSHSSLFSNYWDI